MCRTDHEIAGSMNMNFTNQIHIERFDSTLE